MQADTSMNFKNAFSILLLSALLFTGISRFLPRKLFSEKPSVTKGVLVDSMLLDAMRHSGDKPLATGQRSVPIEFAVEQGVRFPTEMSENYQGAAYLVPFFEKLLELENGGQGHVRIAYFGDSMTDGDMIVQDYRAMMQEKFGGLGVGFVPIASESSGSRSSVTHTYSPNWLDQSFLTVKKPKAAFGVNGHVFLGKDSATTKWVSYKAGRRKFTSILPDPTLFYGHSRSLKGRMTAILGKDTVYKKLNPYEAVNTISLQGNYTAITSRFFDADSIPFYGFSFDSGSGVNVDNFSQRGNSGIPILRLNVPVMNAFQKQLDYDLIVLHYGTNVLNYGTKDFTWYGKNMKRVVRHLRACFPGVPILVISTADKATRYGLEMKTDSAVLPLTSAQRQYAIEEKTGFVNLYTLMGGDGSMTRWADEEPVMANKDYTHFNFRGSEKVGKLLYEQLMKNYNTYKILRQNSNAGKAGN
jgi:lysophospholipase L1-like esterase